VQTAAILLDYKSYLLKAIEKNADIPEFPENLIVQHLDNTWHDTAGEVVSNWIGLVYQLTHSDRKKPFMDNVDINNPLGM